MARQRVKDLARIFPDTAFQCRTASRKDPPPAQDDASHKCQSSKLIHYHIP